MLFNLDFSWVALICGSFARIWIFLRTDLLVQTFRKPQASKPLVEGRIEPREILSLTLVFDHDVMAGAGSPVCTVIGGADRERRWAAKEQPRTAMKAEPLAVPTENVLV